MADDKLTPPVFPVAVDEDALVGENNETHEVEADVNSEAVAPQKVGSPAVPVETVPVYEVAVKTDERVDYVIVPPEGRGDATLPIHAFVNAKTPEEIFAADASEQEEPASDEERADAASRGTTPVAERNADKS